MRFFSLSVLAVHRERGTYYNHMKMATASNSDLEPIQKPQVTLYEHMPVAAADNSDLEPIQRPQVTSDSHLPVAAADNNNLETKPQVIFRCKKCRRIVAAQENLVPHKPGRGESCFKWQKRSDDSQNTGTEPVECTSIFVEPMKWMETGDLNLHHIVFCCNIYVHKMLILASILSLPVQEGYVQERLHCMGCKGRLGYFNWAGMQCSCGAWVNPAFQLHKSRLDECHI